MQILSQQWYNALPPSFSNRTTLLSKSLVPALLSRSSSNFKGVPLVALYRFYICLSGADCTVLEGGKVEITSCGYHFLDRKSASV